MPGYYTRLGLRRVKGVLTSGTIDVGWPQGRRHILIRAKPPHGPLTVEGD